PDLGVNDMQSMVQNTCILGMVGPFSSQVARAEMPIAAQAGLVMISPASTNPGLTLREYASIDGIDFDQLHPAGKQVNFFRISLNDVVQGIVDADLAYADFPTGLTARSAYVVSDRTTYGRLTGEVFVQEFQGKGGTIVGSDDIAFGDVDIADEAARIA